MAFWSAVVKTGAKPAVFVPPPEGWTLHLSQAALPCTVPAGRRVSVLHKAGEDDTHPIVICTLVANSQDSVPLDLFLDAYSEFSLLGGHGEDEVHLTGYYSPPDEVSMLPNGDTEFDPFDVEDEDEDDEDEDLNHLATAGHPMLMSADDDEDEDEDEDEDDEDEDEDEDDEPGVTRRPHVTIEEIHDDNKEQKPQKKQQGKQQAAAPPGKDAKKPEAKPAKQEPVSGTKRPAKQEPEEQPSKKGPGANGNSKQEVKAEPATPVKAKTPQGTPQAVQLKGDKKNTRTYENGFTIVDVAMGPPNGKLAKKGKKVKMAYVGRLKHNGKEFDSSKGKPFQFRLGVGEVIKGWDLGVEGMRVGDKRKLIIPPQLAYGTAGVKGAIPPNATLEFDVELLDVK